MAQDSAEGPPPRCRKCRRVSRYAPGPPAIALVAFLGLGLVGCSGRLSNAERRWCDANEPALVASARSLGLNAEVAREEDLNLFSSLADEKGFDVYAYMRVEAGLRGTSYDQRSPITMTRYWEEVSPRTFARACQTAIQIP